MCGIAGFLCRKAAPVREELATVVTAMANAIRHRGPDGEGQWVDETRGIALGHRRLTIIDLSVTGSQPMESASGRYIITYNGEIYNFQLLRQELVGQGYPFRGSSDTEVLLAAIEVWGLDEALTRVQGMFAFSLWDRNEGELSLVRDRVGKKPLYYGWSGNVFLFGSEIKALRQHPDFDDTLDRDVLMHLIQYGWIADPLCIYKSVRKLAPGTLLRVRAEVPPWSVAPESYWSAKDAVECGRREPFEGTYEQAVDRLDCLLRQSVTQRMISDVELGIVTAASGIRTRLASIWRLQVTH